MIYLSDFILKSYKINQIRMLWMEKKSVIFMSSGLFSLFIWNSYLSLNRYFEISFKSDSAIKIIVSSFSTTGLIFLFLNEIIFTRLNFYKMTKWLLVLNYSAFTLLYFICEYVPSISIILLFLYLPNTKFEIFII